MAERCDEISGDDAEGLKRLGAAVVNEWDNLPKKVQVLLLGGVGILSGGPREPINEVRQLIDRLQGKIE
jgi:hypothetical protein